MYGMVHRAARQMIIEHHGEASWAQILANSGLGDDSFISANVYSDDVTMVLLGAISEFANESVTFVLNEFGKYWIEFAYKGDYRSVMNMTGNDLFSFLGNLNRMHDSVQLSIPGARLPTFIAENAQAQSIDVTYISEREGLEPFVEGLLIGLMKHFGHDGEVRLVGPNDRGVLFRIILASP